jgi:hypothetical protein
VIDDFVGRVAADNRINGKFGTAKHSPTQDTLGGTDLSGLWWSLHLYRPGHEVHPCRHGCQQR